MGNVSGAAREKFIVVGIDGTGSTEWMKADGSNSHTYRFIHEFRYGTYGVDRMWFHGPSDTMSGKETEPILENALRFITNRIYQLFPDVQSKHRAFDMFDVNTCKQSEYYSNQMSGSEYSYSYSTSSDLRYPRTVTPQLLQSQPLSIEDVKVVLIGHSRGGLAATVLAKMLSPLVKVYFLGLYDSVDRQPCLDGMVVENVHIAYHARRHPEMNSRWYFGNTSVQYKSDLPVQEAFFHTTHGGIGGDFVDDPNQISLGSDATCVPYGKQKIATRAGVREIDRTHPVAKREGRPINRICEEGKRSADRFIRDGAKLYGLPVN